MKQKRNGHACATISDAESRFKAIIVAGGNTLTGYVSITDDVEVFSISSNEWIAGPKLPRPNLLTSIVKADPFDQNISVYLVGGRLSNGPSSNWHRSEIYSLSKNLSSWNLMGNLKNKRAYHVALYLEKGNNYIC